MLRLADLRRAEASDRAAIAALQHTAYARNRPLLGVEPLPLFADYAEILTTMEVWLAEDGSKLLGCLILESRAADLLIWSIATDPAEQTKGVGLSMLEAADARARQLGHGQVRLYTGTPLRHLVAWYGRHGFVVERIEALPDRSLTHMIKRLTS